MTLEEKASLMSGKNFWQTRPIERFGIPSMAMADGPHGLRKQAEDGDHLGLVEGVKATCFPTSATVSNSWDIALCKAVGTALGKEAVYHNVNVILGPGLNIKRNPLCGRNFEYFSEDPYLSGKLAGAYVNGIQSQGVGACLKHYAVNNQETLRMINDSVLDERTLREIYLTGFEIALKESQPKVVMSAYNRINGIYANEHKYLLRDILVDEWNFSGMVVSDWGGSNDAVESVRAGSHMEMPTPGLDSVDQIVEAVHNDFLDEEILDERVVEYLKVLEETEIAENSPVDYEAHHDLAREAAEKSIVLLKNEHVLPLKNSKIAVIGDFASKPRYQGAGSSMVNPYKLDSFINTIDSNDLEIIGYAKGYHRCDKRDQSLIDEALQLASRVDTVVYFMGLDEVRETEGNDRHDMKLNENQITLLKLLRKHTKEIIVVLSGGSSIEMPWTDLCDGILHGYLSGQAGAKAIVNVLTGKVNPCGKLTEVYPLYYSDVSNSNYYPGTEATSEYREGLYYGYRYFDKVNLPVKYPFGFGLSYTKFGYSQLEIRDDGIEVTITNIGDYDGAEIVQVYVSRDQEIIHRPVKELKGFDKVFLKKGESKRISIYFDEYTFRYFDIHENNFLIQEGTYSIKVGASSEDIRVSGSLFVKGHVPLEDSKLLDVYFSGQVKDVEDLAFKTLLGRKIPDQQWDRKQALGLNDSIMQMSYAKNPLARLVRSILLYLRDRSYKKGKPDLNLFFLTSMPFRAIAKMSDGHVSIEMTERIIDIVNGKFFKGLSGLIKSFMTYKKRGSSV